MTYLLICSDDTYYCGITNNLQKRMKAHNSGKGAKYTVGRVPVRVLTVRDGLTRFQAAKLECAVKKVPKDRKVDVLKNGDVGF